MVVLPYIDDIAIEKQRGVIFVSFYKNMYDYCKRRPRDELRCYEWDTHKTRNTIIGWLDKNKIGHRECYGRYNPCMLERPWFGTTYIDVPFDLNDPEYKKVLDYLEYENGLSKFENTWLYYFALEYAVKAEDRDYNKPGWNP